MTRQSLHSESHLARVTWTSKEKALVVNCAVDTQREHPDLAGLPLLRVSMKILPQSRRRKVIAVSQVAWFEPAVVAEIKRRTEEERAKDDLIPIMREHMAAQGSLVTTNCEWFVLHQEWHAEQVAWQDKMDQNQQNIVATLLLVIQELRKLNETLGQPVMVQAPCECQAARPISGRADGKN